MKLKFEDVKHLYPNMGYVKTRPTEDVDWVKTPSLYQLSDMTEEQAQELFHIIWNLQWGESMWGTLTNIEKYYEYENSIGFKAIDGESKVGLTVELDRGVELSFDGAKMKVNQFLATKYLLDNNFDLFNLIENYQAVSASSFLNPYNQIQL